MMNEFNQSLTKLQMVQNLGAIKGTLYIEASLLRIKLVRSKMIKEIESGFDIKIPVALS